jgi:ligand-binding SRPBCC domain-containing protein
MGVHIDRHPRGGWVLTATTDLPAPIAHVFEFFAEAQNLELITPPWLNFRIVEHPDTMGAGSEFAYRLRIHGVPVHWRSHITDWQPPHRFVDVQLTGPYRYWVHEHRFDELDGEDGGTRMLDRVRFDIPGRRGPHVALVLHDLRRIFEFRGAQHALHFGEVPAAG